MTKRIVSGLYIAAAVFMLFTGCRGKSTANKAENQTVTISVWSWDVALMQLQSAAEKFKQTHPNVEFEFEEMGTDQIYNKLSTSLATGNGIADVVSIEGDVFAGYVDKFPQGFLDLTDVVDERNFLPVKIGEVKFNGKIHAFPWDAGPMGLFYRKDYFEQAGVKASDIVTWSDFIVAGKKISAVCKTPSGKAVKMLPIRPTKPSLYAVFCAELGQSVFNADGKPLVDTPQSLQAMHLFKEIYDAGIRQNYNGWDEYEGTVANQTVATIPEAVWMIGTIKDKAPDTAGKWGVIDLPKISAGGSSSCANGGSVVAIHAKTAVPDLVKEFVKFAMTDTALQAEGFEKYGLYPSFIPSYSEPVFEQGDDFFGGDAIYNVFIENGKKIPAFPQNPNIAEANDMIGAAVSRILLKNEDIDTTLIELQRDLSTKFAR